MDWQGKLPKGFSSETRFLVEQFSSPATPYAPVYTWMWNGRVTKEQTDRQLEEMARLGIKRIYILPMPKSFRPTSFPTPMEPEYLSEGYLEAYRYAVNKAKAQGMDVWLYDEGGWPSGGACGQVMLEDPTLTQETLKAEKRQVKKGDVYLAKQETEAAFLDGKRVCGGETLTKDGVLTEYLRVKTSFPKVNSADLPDITKERSAPLFLSLTHERYAAALGKDLGGMTALFTDEPTAPRPFPYTEEVKALFFKRFGEPIEGYLPVLMGDEPCNEGSAKIKVEFYRLLSDLFIERFLKREKRWANDHSLAFVGHLDKDDEANAAVTSGSFGLLKALRAFDVPGVDAIRRQIFPPKGKTEKYGKNGFFPILASSAAAQTGGRHALSESFAVYGAGLSYDEMRYVLNYQAMCGVNVFNFMLIPYAREGYALAGELPHFTEATYPHLAAFNRYAERISYLFSLGKRVAKVALYQPVADGVIGNPAALASYEALGRDLQQKQVPFDVVDDDFFSFGEIAEGNIKAHLAAYDTVILPDVTYLPKESASALTRFAASGGKVLAATASAAEKVAGAILFDDAVMASPLPIATEGILLAQEKTEDGDLYFLMNESGEDKTFTLPAGKQCYLITPVDGKVIRFADETFTVTLTGGEIAGVLFTERSIGTSPAPRFEKELTLTDWEFRPTKRVLMENAYREETLSAPFAPAVLGNWEKALGAGFSGTAEYKTTFRLPPVKEAALTLGKAAIAAEVTLNGIPLGATVLPPYRYDLPKDLLKEENTLVVRVTSGVANEFERTKAFEKYYPWQLGNYLKEERVFHADSKESGLFGKVKIYYR